MAAGLAVFDFDRTIVDDDSDATIIEKLKEKRSPPEWIPGCNDWTPYMSDVFEHAFTAGLEQEDILSAIAGMRPTPGAEALITELAAAGWHVLVITDANSIFVNHWLEAHGLKESVEGVITNAAFWAAGRLYIEPCMRQAACAHCPPNLCKSAALAQWCAARERYNRIVYTGDGRNDFCPASNLPAGSIVFPRKGYPLDDLVTKAQCATPPLAAKVVRWEHCDTILKELLSNERVKS